MLSLTTKKVCPVCNQDLYDGNPFKSFTKCRHSVHEQCLSSDSTITSAPPCPICSKPTEKSSVSTQQPAILINSANEDQSPRSDKTHQELDHSPASPKQARRIRSIVRPETPDSSSPNSKENLSSKISTTSWSCSQCTYENDSNTDSCEMCAKERKSVDLPEYVTTKNFDSPIELEKSIRTVPSDPLNTASSTLLKEKQSNGNENSFGQWSCLHCTYENDFNTDPCDMCGQGKRPFHLSQCSSMENAGLSSDLEQSVSTFTEDQPNFLAPRLVKTEKSDDNRESSVEWSCLHCTYQNLPESTRCEICQSPRPSYCQPSFSYHEDRTHSTIEVEPSESDSYAYSSTSYPDRNNIRCDHNESVFERKSAGPDVVQKPMISASNEPKKRPECSLQPSISEESYRTHPDGRDNERRVEYTNGKSSNPRTEIFPKKDNCAANADSISNEVKTSSVSINPKTTSSTEYRVFIPNLPMIGTDQELETILRERFDRVRPSNSYKIRCYSSIGIAMIDVPNEYEQNYLINNLQSTVLDVEKSLILRFVDDFQSNSFLVLHGNPIKSVSEEDLRQRWQTVLSFSVSMPCKTVSTDYPNIFKVTFPNFSEFLRVIHLNDFTFNDQIVRIYHRSDACFFEDLPTNITEAEISSAIESQVGHRLNKSLVYVQCNSKNCTAMVIVSDAIVEWNKRNDILLNNQLYHKKQKLSLRLVIPRIPEDLSDDLVKKNALFENRLSGSKRVGDRLILDLDDPSIYAKCLDIGALRVNGQLLEIQAFAQVQAESKNRELIVKKWYETEMVRHDVNLKDFLSELGKPFFNGRWNAKEWLDQFLPICGIQDKDADRRRRLLRLTVMTDTFKIAEQKRYRIELDGKEQEIPLNPTKMRTVVYKSQSMLHHQRELSNIFERPFAQTKVSVINKDCLIVYNELVQENKSPLLLNMANADTPGGGYRQGAGAQEENVFRRSNYHLSLDAEMDEKREADRFFKTETGTLKPVNRSEKIYPIAEFGAIYTSGITVFRDTEENGYAYLDKPWTNVCAIAVAAYSRPELHADQQTIVDKLAVGTRKKIENLFSVALLHKHDCLVLSALGCGAFRNPPEHVVAIFQSVIEQYAGYFEEIRFAIVDDHNTGGRWNPTGNYVPFTKLDGFVARSVQQKLETNMIIGPFLIREINGDRFKVDQVKITDLPLCQYGGLCHNQADAQHAQKYVHPPLCYDYQKCQRVKDDKVHAMSFTHLIQCQHGGMCEQINDSQHRMRYNHPEFCHDEGRCENKNKEHLKKFSHVPICKRGVECYDYMQKNEKHCLEFRHIQKECSYGSKCAHFHNREHMATYQHPFRQPCPLTPYACQFYQMVLDKRADPSKKLDRVFEEHCVKFAHVCLFGQDCHDTSPSHMANSIHVHRIQCPDKGKCSKLTDEEHLNSYTHPNIHDIRYLCHESGAKCRDRWKPEHIQRYRHAGNSNHLGVAQYSGLNSQINFVRNHHKLADGVLQYAQDQRWKQAKSHMKEIINWIRCLQPIHRCNQVIFESILVHGHVMSLSYMDRLRNPRFVANAVIQHPQVRQIIDHRENAALVQAVREYVRALVAVEFDEQGKRKSAPVAVGIPMGGIVTPPIVAATTSSSSSSDDIEERKLNLRLAESQIKPHLKDFNLKTIQRHTKMIVEASIKLNQSKPGIAYHVDQSLGTNEQIFSILGPHLGHYYGDIFIVFKRDIMYHPDANFSVQSATSFGPSGNAYKWRPWLTDPGNLKDRVQHFHWNKLHCSVPDYEYAAALELMAVTGLKKQSLDVSLDHVKTRWMHNDSHTVFESHLPQLIPLDYVDRVYIPKNIFEALPTDQQDAAKANFGDNLKITKHAVTTDPATHDDSRKEYQNYVLDKINHQIAENHPQENYGFTVTLPASKLKQYIIMPMSIVQSSHRHNAPKDAIDTVYIYWQALGGDIILALSKDKIENDKDQLHNRSLLCHISDLSSSNSDHEYREPYSYITVGYPLSHEILMGDIKSLKSKSNSFHRGCNTHDFITYCLILKRKIGQAVLIHVGSNGIYNQQTLDCSFQRNEIDLSALNYIQISANNRPVPIRNLIITHEPIEEFHVGSDKSSASKSDDDKPAKPSTEEKKSGFKELWDRAKDIFLGSGDRNQRQPCRDSVNCLLQYSRDRADEHNKKYSHPCRFSEICRSPDDHPHFEHIPHRVSMCKYDENCRERIDPIHRAKFRHTNLPDFLFPCRDQRNCRNKTGEHRMKYSHGENVLHLISKEKESNDESRRRERETTDYGESNEFL